MGIFQGPVLVLLTLKAGPRATLFRLHKQCSWVRSEATVCLMVGKNRGPHKKHVLRAFPPGDRSGPCAKQMPVEGVCPHLNPPFRPCPESQACLRLISPTAASAQGQ